MEGWSTFEPDSGMLINTPASLSFQSSPMAVLSLEVTNGALGFQMFFSQDCCQGCRPLPDRYTSTALWRSEVVKQQLSLSLSLSLALSRSHTHSHTDMLLMFKTWICECVCVYACVHLHSLQQWLGPQQVRNSRRRRERASKGKSSKASSCAGSSFCSFFILIHNL